MSLAYLILGHKDAIQVEFLFDAIYDPSDLFILHFDRRSPGDLHALGKKLQSIYPNVHLLPARKIIWGGFSMPAVQMEAIRTALKKGDDWSHFINLTGQDFPLQPRSHIEAFLTANSQKSFLSWFDPLATGIWKNPRRRLEFRYLDWAWLHGMLALPMIGRRLRLIFGWRNTFPHLPFYRRPWPDFFHFYGGANHVALSRAACRLLIEDSIARRIIQWLRYAAHPDEIVFQSVLLNSSLQEYLVNDDLRYIQFEHPEDPHPKVLSTTDLLALRASPKLWARKFDRKADSAILDQLAADVNGSA